MNLSLHYEQQLTAITQCVCLRKSRVNSYRASDTKIYQQVLQIQLPKFTALQGGRGASGNCCTPQKLPILK